MATTLEDYIDNKSHEIISPFPRTTIQVYFDGLCQPYNPGGTACFAFIVKNEEGNTIYNEYGLAAHNSTNNVAEYACVIKALVAMSYTESHKNEPNNTLEDKSEGSRVCGFIIEE